MTTGTEIRPFRIDVPEEEVTGLRRRQAAIRWPDRETVTDRSQGGQSEKLQELVDHRGNGYDGREVEAMLNALRLIMTHGRPGPILELPKTIGPLTDPTAYGGLPDGAQVFASRFG